MKVFIFDSFTVQRTNNYYLLNTDLLFYTKQSTWRHLGDIAKGPIPTEIGIVLCENNTPYLTIDNKAEEIT